MDNSQDRGEIVENHVDSSEAKIAERRAAMRKIAVGAFTVPVVLAALTSTPAHAS